MKKGNGGPVDLTKISFSVIRQRGDPKTAKTLDGFTVHKEKEIYCENPFNPDEEARKTDFIRVKCIDYHNEHFVYLDPNLKALRWFAWCTCGSAAVIVRGSEVYDKTPGIFLGCFFHMTFRRHATGKGRRWT